MPKKRGNNEGSITNTSNKPWSGWGTTLEKGTIRLG